MRAARTVYLLLLAACGDPAAPGEASDGESSGESSTGEGSAGGSTATSSGSTATTDAATSGASGGGSSCPGIVVYPDRDHDGFGDPAEPTPACEAPGDHVMNDEDCDDGDPDVHPGAAEDACDGVDRDCSGHWKTRVPTICPTIQAAVDVAPDGAEVCVEPGIYAEHVVLAGRDIVLLGLEGAGATTIDGSGTGRPLTITQGEGPKTRIEGFTLRGGAALEGAGLYMAGASPTLVELVFADNVASGDSAYGGGAFISESSSLLRDVAFRDNTAGYYGGGLYVSESPGLRIERGDFRDNHALYGAGAAIYFSAAELENVVFAGNKGGMGGGLLVQGGVASLLQAAFVKNTSEYGGSLAATSGSTVTVRNAVFADNVATWSPDLGGAIQRCTTDEIEDGECDASVTVAFTDAWQNLPLNYGNMPDPGGQDGNVSVAPGFVDQGGVSPALWDLHLGPGSPLIDAGDPQRLDADASRSDIGAYGGPSA